MKLELSYFQKLNLQREMAIAIARVFGERYPPEPQYLESEARNNERLANALEAAEKAIRVIEEYNN